jgi:glutamine amidotransferase
VSAETLYAQKFCCAIAKENIFAVQFHPEKSSTAGLQLIKNFVQWAV